MKIIAGNTSTHQCFASKGEKHFPSICENNVFPQQTNILPQLAYKYQYQMKNVVPQSANYKKNYCTIIIAQNDLPGIG